MFNAPPLILYRFFIVLVYSRLYSHVETIIICLYIVALWRARLSVTQIQYGYILIYTRYYAQFDVPQASKSFVSRVYVRYTLVTLYFNQIWGTISTQYLYNIVFIKDKNHRALVTIFFLNYLRHLSYIKITCMYLESDEQIV